MLTPLKSLAPVCAVLVLIGTAAFSPAQAATPCNLSCMQEKFGALSLDALEAKAKAGDHDAQFMMAMRYLDPKDGSMPDIDAAGMWLGKSANGGHMLAKEVLDTMRMAGEAAATPETPAEDALETQLTYTQRSSDALQKLADQGDIDAALVLCARYETKAADFPVEAAQGDAACTTAAEAGNPMARFSRATAYMDGKDRPKNPELAKLWLTKAAEQDLPAAQYLLGTSYRTGSASIGLDGPDPKQAAIWLGKAAAAGDKTAMAELGTLYADILLSPDRARYKDALEYVRTTPPDPAIVQDMAGGDIRRCATDPAHKYVLVCQMWAAQK